MVLSVQIPGITGNALYASWSVCFDSSSRFFGERERLTRWFAAPLGHAFCVLPYIPGVYALVPDTWEGTSTSLVRGTRGYDYPVGTSTWFVVFMKL